MSSSVAMPVSPFVDRRSSEPRGTSPDYERRQFANSYEDLSPDALAPDPDGDAAALTVSASRRNPAVVDAEGIAMSGTGATRTLRITPNPRSWSAAPDMALAWPEPPQLLELRLAVGYSAFPAFAVIVDKVDHGRVLVVERMTPDSNKELRLSLNSSAFGPGEYRLRLQGYTWRGDRVDVGWVRLLVTDPR